jgi:signal transduction histidine kinase/ligand-binding sensor domain-containing protein/DNA-binding response OmpR family regulator
MSFVQKKVKKLKPKIFIIFVGICFYLLGNTQPLDIKFKSYSIEDDLSNSTIESITQDKKGFIWIGTRHGLNRFDGKTFEKFYVQNTSNGLTHNYINSLLVTDEDKVWVGTKNGLSIFHPETHTISRASELSATYKMLDEINVTGLLEMNASQLWISTQNHGLLTLDLTKKEITQYTIQPEKANTIISNNIHCIHEYDQKIWIGSPLGLQYYDLKNSTWQTIAAFVNQNVSCIAHLSDTLVVGTAEGGLYFYNQKSGKINQKSHSPKDQNSLGSNIIKSLIVTKNNTLWVGCINGGLNLYDGDKDVFYRYTNEPMNPVSLSQRTVSALFEDNQGNLWIGTHRGGINLFAPKLTAFQLERKGILSNSLSYNDVKTFYEAKNGDIWIGTDGGGLNIWNPKTKKYTHYFLNPSNKFSLPSNEVIDIMEDSKGNIWIGTWGGGLCKFESSSNRFLRFQHDVSNVFSVSSNYIQNIYEDHQKNIWVGTYYGGLNKFVPESGKFYKITSGTGQTKFEGQNCLIIAQDNLHNLWFGTDDGGLNCLETKTGSFLHYFNTAQDKPDIRVIHISRTNKIYVGHHGLYMYDNKVNDFKKISTHTELDQVFVKAIEEDQNGNLWISTSNGIFKLDPISLKVKKYNKADGLQGNEFEANASLTTREGNIFFGGINGFNYFHPAFIKDNSYLPPIFINQLTFFNKKTKKHETLYPQEGNTTSLSYEQNTFSIHLSALNYITPENNTFAYMLDGWDADWITDTKNEVTYTNVTPGNYVFRVKAANNDGVWNTQEKKLKIAITPPFYATYWFISLVILVVISGLSYLYKLRRDLEMEKYEERKKEELHNLELQFFTDISHDFKTPLSLILGSLEKIKKYEEFQKMEFYLSTISRNAYKLLNLLNELMDFRKVEAGALALNVKPGNLKIFIEELSEEYKIIATDKNIHFDIQMHDSPAETTYFDRQVLEKIVSNILGNAFKYTPDSKSITVEISYQNMLDFTRFKNFAVVNSPKLYDKYFTIQISDTGHGISKENLVHIFDRYSKFNDNQNGSGLGLAFVKSLTLLHQGNIRIYSEKNRGTSVFISIPYLKEYYENKDSKQRSNDKEYIKLESLRTDDDLLLSLVPNDADRHEEVAAFHQNMASILIVEDNSELRHYIKDSLMEYNIFEASDGVEGLALAIKKSPDIIISDVMMPNMDGYEFCKKVKENVLTNHIPFIMLTAKSSDTSRIEGLDSGADYYFTKPFSGDVLLLTIKNILTSKTKFTKYYKNSISKTEVEEVVNHETEEDFLASFISLIEEDMSNPDLNIDDLCHKVGMSRTKLYHKIKLSTGMSISDFIRTLRLKKAATMLLKDDITIAEAMYNVGIQTHSYFTKAFKTEFGVTPSQYVKEHNSRL